MSLIAGAIIGSIASGVLNGAMSYASAKGNSKAYRDAANQIKEAAGKYSGANAYEAMRQAGNVEGNIVNRQALSAQLQNQPRNNSATMAYQANTAAQQAAMNTAGGLADLYKNLKGPSATSDENQKESPKNNDSGLPESDIEDSMRQLETVQYQYKDPNVPGCDDEVHKSGFTAQSAEKTPLYGKAVKNCSDGVKRIDQWKLLESVTAATAQLQREIDELRSKK